MHSQCGDKCVSALTLGKELESKNELLLLLLLFFQFSADAENQTLPRGAHSTHGSRESFTKFVEV